MEREFLQSALSPAVNLHVSTRKANSLSPTFQVSQQTVWTSPGMGNGWHTLLIRKVVCGGARRTATSDSNSRLPTCKSYCHVGPLTRNRLCLLDSYPENQAGIILFQPTGASHSRRFPMNKQPTRKTPTGLPMVPRSSF